MFACTRDEVDEGLMPTGDGRITIQSTLDDMLLTRATDSPAERTVTHIDVFAVDASGNIAYYERNTTGNNSGADEQGAGTLTLNVARRATQADGTTPIFAQGAEYKFVLVANATATEEAMAGVTTLSALEALVQDDSFDPELTGGDGDTDGGTSVDRQTLLHLSGTEQGKNDGGFETPQTFLMDAVAVDIQDATKTSWVVNPATGSVSNLTLKAEFKRAAAKIIVNIEQGPDVEFRTTLTNVDDSGTAIASETAETAQYDFYKLPASTFVLPNDAELVGVRLINTAPMKPNKETFIWASEEPAAENSIQIIGYAYAHSWSDVDLTNETSLILNIPMMWNKDGKAETGYTVDDTNPGVDGNSKEATAARSWYKVPLSQGKKFERNKCYIVNITINAVGASSKSTAIQLRDIEYKTLEWQTVDVNVGGSSEAPKYLVLNTDLVEMYNVNFDNTSLEFSSSSPIASVVLTDKYTHNIGTGAFSEGTDNYDAYYLNKYNSKTSVPTTVRQTISASAEADVLNGGISIISPIIKVEDSEELEQQIQEALGNPPTAPTLEEPVYTGTNTIPDEVPEVENPGERPSAPNPYDYVPENEDNYGSYGYNYRYNEETGTFQRQYWGVFTGEGDWTDIETPEEYTEALEAYEQYDEKLAAYQQYLKDKAAYDEAVEALKNDPLFTQYLAEKEAYDREWERYNEALATYNTQAQAIREAAGNADSHYNTIRYLEFVVTNEQGLTATFRVMQYPTIYVTNAVGWYSYREDFKNVNSTSHATTYHIKGDRIGGIGYNQGTYTLYNGDSGFWYSKVSSNPEQTHQGTASYYSYYWANANSTSPTEDSYEYDDENTRMYNIKVTATSSKYTVGVPKRVNVTQTINYDGETVSKTYDTTDDSDANSKLVSPSFMTASRLGVLTTNSISYSSSSGTEARETEMYNLFSYHCSNYVEVKQVVEDGVTKKVVYDDWRLPTAAEIGIIIELQPNGSSNNTADKAIDYLLNAGYYFSASGPVENSKYTSGYESSISVRCVRDAVDEPAAKSLTAQQTTN